MKAPMADIGSQTLVAIIRFWTLVADSAFWTLVIDSGFCTLMADLRFWTLVADFGIWPLVADSGFQTLMAYFGFWTLMANSGFWPLVSDSGFWTLVAYFGFQVLIHLIRLKLCRELKYVYMILLTWLSLNKLKLNCDKTELLVIGLQHSPVSQLFSFTAVDGSVINPINSARNISVIFYNNLNMESQVAVICNSTFFTFAIFLVLGSSCQLKAPKFQHMPS